MLAAAEAPLSPRSLRSFRSLAAAAAATAAAVFTLSAGAVKCSWGDSPQRFEAQLKLLRVAAPVSAQLFATLLRVSAYIHTYSHVTDCSDFAAAVNAMAHTFSLIPHHCEAQLKLLRVAAPVRSLLSSLLLSSIQL